MSPRTAYPGGRVLNDTKVKELLDTNDHIMEAVATSLRQNDVVSGISTIWELRADLVDELSVPPEHQGVIPQASHRIFSERKLTKLLRKVEELGGHIAGAIRRSEIPEAIATVDIFLAFLEAEI